MLTLPSLDTLDAQCALLVIPAVLLADRKARTFAAFGIAMLALAAASLRVMPGAMPIADLARRATEIGIGPETLAVDAGFLVAAIGLLIAGTVHAARTSRDAVSAIAAIAVTLGCAMILWQMSGFLRLAGPARATLAALALVGLGWGLTAGAAREGIGRVARRLLRWSTAPAAHGDEEPNARWLAVVVAGTLLTTTLPTLWTTLMAAILVAVASPMLAPRSRRRGALLVALLGAVVLTAACYAITVIAGEFDPPIASLIDAPFSTPAEYKLAPYILVGVWCWLGLVPFTRLSANLWGVPAALIVLTRIGVPTVGEGIDHWRPIIWMAVAVAAWAAAVTRRRDLVVVCVALLALTSGSTMAVPMALLILVGAVIATRGERLLASPWRIVARLGWIAAAWGAARALDAAIAQQVVLTLMVLGAVMVTIAANAPPDSTLATGPVAE